MKGLSDLIQMFLELLYPVVKCPVCSCLHPGICIPCTDALKVYDEGGIFDQDMGVSLFCHQEQVKILIANFKKKMMFSSGATMVDLIFERYGNELMNFDFITFAPSSKKSRKKLGFDHGKYLASALSGKTGVQVMQLFTAAGSEQKVLDREERKDNARKIRLRKGKFNALRGKKILLIDDVYTTGSTVHRCRELLEELGMECRYLTFSRV